jgi:hypothetical protein
VEVALRTGVHRTATPMFPTHLRTRYSFSLSSPSPLLYRDMGMVIIGLWGVISSNRSHLPISTLRHCAKSVISAESIPEAWDHPEEEQLFRDLWEGETQREVVMESLKADSVR